MSKLHPTALRFYHSHLNGINVRISTVEVYFLIKIPKYLNFISTEISSYYGWEFYLYSINRKNWILRCSKELPVTDAFTQAIWFRQIVIQTIRSYSPNPSRSRGPKVSPPAWVEGYHKHYEEQASEDTFQYSSILNKNRVGKSLNDWDSTELTI